MIELDQIDKKAASVLDGYLVRKDLVRTLVGNFRYPHTWSSSCSGGIAPARIRKRLTKG